LGTFLKYRFSIVFLLFIAFLSANAISNELLPEEVNEISIELKTESIQETDSDLDLKLTEFHEPISHNSSILFNPNTLDCSYKLHNPNLHDVHIGLLSPPPEFV
jgi:hypothetical protein